MFRLEQDVYETEGIDWAHVEFVDNQVGGWLGRGLGWGQACAAARTSHCLSSL